VSWEVSAPPDRLPPPQTHRRTTRYGSGGNCARYTRECPSELPAASLVAVGAGGVKHQLRLGEPWLALEDDVEEDRLSGWSTEEDAGA
jgi:hypothetical protein